jgi:uroporphyrin-3 C-methyltransferase
MANDDSQQENPNPQPVPSPQKKSLGKILHILPIIALILAIIALIIALRTLHQNKMWLEDNQNLSKTMQNRDKEQKDNNLQIQALISVRDKSQQALNDQFNALNKAFQSFKVQTQYGHEDWLLLKARYYLELAEIQQHWGNHVELIIALLEQADTVLSTINNASLFVVRQSIAKEITLLKIIPPFDLVGILSKLDAQQSAVDNLTMQVNLTIPTKKSSKQSQDSSWRSQLKQSIHTLEKMVVIRHRDHDIQPLFSSLEIALFREHIRNNLQEAKWGLLQHNAAVYNLALAQAIKNVKRFFDAQAENTLAFIQELNHLKKISFNNQPPLNLEVPLQRLNQLINTKSSDKIL